MYEITQHSFDIMYMYGQLDIFCCQDGCKISYSYDVMGLSNVSFLKFIVFEWH
jgi:hypothetical protein